MILNVGTGKTVTVIEAVKQLLKKNPRAHILLCAPTNSAADLLLARLSLGAGRLLPQVMLRLNAVSRYLSFPVGAILRQTSESS